MNGLIATDVLLAAFMWMYAGLNFFAGFYGSSTIELWKNRGTGSNKNEMTLRFSSITDNLYKVFGTHKIFRILSPSFRNVPFTGLEWSFKCLDEGYNCEGKSIKISGTGANSLV